VNAQTHGLRRWRVVDIVWALSRQWSVTTSWPVMTRGGRRPVCAAFDAVLSFKRCDFLFRKPDRDPEGNCHAIVGEHYALEV
jgi:hypothetical protein